MSILITEIPLSHVYAKSVECLKCSNMKQETADIDDDITVIRFIQVYSDGRKSNTVLLFQHKKNGYFLRFEFERFKPILVDIPNTNTKYLHRVYSILKATHKYINQKY